MAPSLVLRCALSQMPPARGRHGALESGSMSRGHLLTLTSAGVQPDGHQPCTELPAPLCLSGERVGTNHPPCAHRGLRKTFLP